MKRLFLAAAVVAIIAPTARADVLINIDLSVANEITMTAQPGLSAATISGSDGIGIYFDAFYAGSGVTGLNETLVSGDITNAANPSDGTPNLFRSGTADTGLNLFSWSSDATVDFTAGALAFTGTATWTLDADDYADMLAGGGAGGDIYFPADDAGDVAGATLIGEYTVTSPIPEPSSLALLGLVGIACIVRRRRG